MRLLTLMARAAVGTGLWLAGVAPGSAAPTFQQTGNLLVMSNANVVLDYDLNAGTASFYWQNSEKIGGFYAGVNLAGGYVKGINFSNRTWLVTGSNQVAVTAHAANLPDMTQYFILDQTDSFVTKVTMTSSNLSSSVSANWMGPVVVDTNGFVDIGITNDNRALFVPFDNDGFVSYNSEAMNGSDTGSEVGAFYDNVSRNGLVIGSVTHDTWKTGVYWHGANNKLNQLNVYGGLTDAWTWDVMPHGAVSGTVISSPLIFAGFGADWRTTMEAFADENARYVPKLTWTNGVPFGWNSWGVTNYQNHITYAAAIAVSDSIHTNLQSYGFANNGTTYVNLDSYWDNLNSSQLQNFTAHCRANGQKAGVYWAPFVYWGTLAQSSNAAAPGSSYKYSDLLLRTTNGSDISNDGGIALDPTHPGTQALINYEINLFTNYGFSYVKLDFLTHGALEGVHYNTSVTTGIEAFNMGMQQLLSQINGSMFISESIAPLFPYQYGHSRRIACDSYTSKISNTAYTMNSVSCGWWLGGRLYQFNDPDAMVFDNGPNTNEDQSRLINCAITGLYLNGSILTNASSVSLAQMCLTNAAINNVARAGATFRPVDGATGTGAASIWAGQAGPAWCIAVFNYTAGTTNRTVSLSSAGVPAGNYIATNLWDGTTSLVSGTLAVSLNAKQAKLFQLTPLTAASLRWSAVRNTGVWDTETSTNWINQSNGLAAVFNPDDQVLFDDTAGAPTGVTVSGTVSPGGITVNSSVNNYTLSGSGTISEAGSLSKMGGSTLTLDAPSSLTGPVNVWGGTLKIGTGTALASATSILVTNGATLDTGYPLETTPVLVAGSGVSGGGALINSSGNPLYDSSGGLAGSVTLLGDTLFGGSTRWDLGRRGTTGTVLSTGGQPYNVTVGGTPGLYFEWDNLALDTNLAGITVLSGTTLGTIGATSFGNPTNLLTISPNATLVFYNDGSVSPQVNKTILVQNGGTIQNGGGTTPVLGPVILGQNPGDTGNLNIGGTAVTLSGVISGAGNLNKIGASPLTLSATNTYTGSTLVGRGTLALAGTGTIASSPVITVSNGAILDVSGRADQTLTLAAGQMLNGAGTVNGSLSVPPGATVAPGGSATGTLMVTNGISLQGTTLMKLNGSGNSDSLQAGGGLVYGGNARPDQYQRQRVHRRKPVSSLHRGGLRGNL